MSEVFGDNEKETRSENWVPLKEALPPAVTLRRSAEGLSSGWMPLDDLLNLQTRKEWLKKGGGYVDWMPLDDLLNLQADRAELGLDGF